MVVTSPLERMILSSSDGNIVTNSSWKCTPFTFSHWASYNFDDDIWNSADAIPGPDNANKVSRNRLNDKISPNAQWITARNLRNEGMVFCRVKFMPKRNGIIIRFNFNDCVFALLTNNAIIYIYNAL